MSETFYLKASHFFFQNTGGGGTGQMAPKTIYVTKTDGSSFLSDGDQVYLWGWEGGAWGTDRIVRPDVRAIQDGTVDLETFTYRGQVQLMDGRFAPWFERDIMFYNPYDPPPPGKEFVVLLPADQPVSEVAFSFWKSLNPFSDGIVEDWDNHNNNGWELTDALGSDAGAEALGPTSLSNLDFEPDALASEAEPGDVRFVDPPADDSPLRAIQGTTAYGREDDDPETIETITYAFGEAGIDLGGDLGVDVVSSAWTEEQKDAYRAALAVYEDVANVRFVEVDDIEAAELPEFVADLSTTDAAQMKGLQYFPSSTGSLGVFNTAYFDWSDGATAVPGGYFFHVLLHEQGHGMGLGHPHDTGGGTTVMRGVAEPFDTGDFGLNVASNTVMSYNLPLGPRTNPFPEFGWAKGLSAFDVAAIQNMYGANTTTRTGDDVYRLDTATGPEAGFMAIWDAGGTDTIRHGGDRFAVIDLREAPIAYEEDGGGYLSYVEGVAAGRTIAAGVTIENAIGGLSRDTITGNDADNVLRGRDGYDSLEGGAGDDRVFGGGGDDTAAGGDGDDVLAGRAGDDSLAGGDGHDVLRGNDGDDTASGGADDDRLVGRDGDDGLSGDAGNDRMSGGQGMDTLEGGTGDDLMRGGADLDTLLGGKGNDALIGGNGADRLVGGNGQDRLFGQAGGDLLDGGGALDILRGGAGDDAIFGRRGDDFLFGGAGRDFLNGDEGNDVLTGGTDFDRFVFEAHGGRDNVVRDFAPEEDRLAFIRIEGVSSLDDLSITARDTGTFVRAHDVGVLLRGIDPHDLTVDNVEFIPA